MDLLTLLRSQWDRVAAAACVLLGVVFLVLGYQGVASSPYVAQELAYVISGGLGGLFLLGAGATLYISADMHDEWRKLDRIEEAIRSLPGAEGDVGLQRPLSLLTEQPSADEREPQGVAKPAARRGRRAPRGAAATVSVDGSMSLRQSIELFEHGPTLAGRVLSMPREVMDSLRVSAATMTFAALALALAYTKAANVSQAKPAVTATVAAAGALVIAGVGSVSGTLGLRRRLTLRRYALLYPFVVRRQAAMQPPVTTPARGADGSDLLVITGGTYAHTRGCAMLTGEPTTAVRADALPAGVRVCALCEAEPS